MHGPLVTSQSTGDVAGAGDVGLLMVMAGVGGGGAAGGGLHQPVVHYF